MNASLPYLSHRWFAPSLVILAGLLGPWMGTDSTATWVVGGLLFLLLGLPAPWTASRTTTRWARTPAGAVAVHGSLPVGAWGVCAALCGGA